MRPPRGAQQLELMLTELPRLTFDDCLFFYLLLMNVNGLNDHSKQTALVDWLKCVKVDIASLQDTHVPSHESIRKWFVNSGFRPVSCYNKSQGTVILNHKSYQR